MGSVLTGDRQYTWAMMEQEYSASQTYVSSPIPLRTHSHETHRQNPDTCGSLKPIVLSTQQSPVQVPFGGIAPDASPWQMVHDKWQLAGHEVCVAAASPGLRPSPC